MVAAMAEALEVAMVGVMEGPKRRSRSAHVAAMTQQEDIDAERSERANTSASPFLQNELESVEVLHAV